MEQNLTQPNKKHAVELSMTYEVKANEEQRRTTVKKRLFLQYLREAHGIVTVACEKTEISRWTYYEWYRTDAEFKAAVEQTTTNINAEVKDILLSLVMKRHPASVRYWLDRQHPEFKPKMTTEVIAGERTLEDLIDEDEERLNKNENEDTTQTADEQIFDREAAQNTEQAGSAAAVQTEPSAEVLLGAQDAPQPDTESATKGDQ